MQVCLISMRVVEIEANSHLRLAAWLVIALTLKDRELHELPLV